MVSLFGIICVMQIMTAVPNPRLTGLSAKHKRVLVSVFSRPVDPTIKWSDIEALPRALGGEIEEREGSRMAVILDDEVQVFHRPHPQPETDKGAVSSVRKWLERLGYKP